MKLLFVLCATVAAVMCVSQKENLISDLDLLGKRDQELRMLMKASEGPSFNEDDVKQDKNHRVMQNYNGKFGMGYNGFQQLKESARNAEPEQAPVFRSFRPEGMHTEKSMAALARQNGLFDLTPAHWEGLLGSRASETCDSTTYNPTSTVLKIVKMPSVSCNTVCRICFPNSLPICMKNQEGVKTCYCTLDSAKPLENFLFRITNPTA